MGLGYTSQHLKYCARAVRMCSIVCGFLVMGCTAKVSTQDEIVASKAAKKQPRGDDSKLQEPEEVEAFSNKEAFTYLTKSCGGCHGPDGLYRSNWDLPAEDKLSVSALEGVAGITRAYQAIANKYDGNEGASPSAMPLGVDFLSNANAKNDAARMLKWFAENMPTVVSDAASLFPVDENSGSKLVTSSEVKVSLNYKCKQVRTGISYLTKLTSSLYQRNPTSDEIRLLGDEERKPISEQKRRELASRLKDPNASEAEFQRIGLKSFAFKVADAAKIAPAEFDPAESRSAIQDDLRNEFYELLKKYYKTKSYRDILLLNKVMVTANTAPLYEGCTAPPAGVTWGECTLPGDRANYFGTVGYMRAKPSSFLENGNNYGRAGSMFVVASGEALLPQTNGPVGVEVNGLPQCLTESTRDARGRVNTTAEPGDEPLTGPFGSLTVPGFGNVCQGCHVRRGLAAGSKVYRPFGKFGEKLSDQVLDEACNAENPGGECRFENGNNSLYKDDLKEAIAEDKANYINGAQRFSSAAPAQKARGGALDANEPVTVQFLKDLLSETAGGAETCIPVDSRTTKQVSSIKEMAEFVVGGTGNVARGLARMIPKAIAGTQLTNQEVILAVSKASGQSDGKLEDMIIEYLATETFACEEE